MSSMSRGLQTTAIICLQPPSKEPWAQRFEDNHKFQFVGTCCVYSESKCETVLLSFAPTNFSLHLVSCWVRHDEQTRHIHILNIFHSPMLLKLCASCFVWKHGHQHQNCGQYNQNETMCHSRLQSPLEPRNWRVSWANLGVWTKFFDLKRCEI